jgi:hypothetical protein
MIRRAAAAFLLLALAACGGSSTDEGTYVEGNVREGLGAPATFGPDFSELELGPKLAGSEFETSLLGPDGDKAGALKGYVACPADLASCDDVGENPVYTYVLEVTPKERSSTFRTNERAYGFTGTAGYDKTAVRAALPGDSRLVMLCSDGVLLWVIEGGDGWRGRLVTLYWQSDQPPSGTSDAYVLITDGVRSEAQAPFPTEGSTDKCR